MNIFEINADVMAELQRATKKFPTWPTDPLHAKAIVDEEVGELEQAILQTTYEPHKSNADDVKAEAIQMIAMGYRFLLSLEQYQYKKAEQHNQEL